MSKGLSIIGATALLAAGLLGSGALLPALQESAPAQETAALMLPTPAAHDVSSMMKAGGKETVSPTGDVLDYSFVFTSADGDGGSGGEPRHRATVPHSWGVNDDVVFD